MAKNAKRAGGAVGVTGKKIVVGVSLPIKLKEDGMRRARELDRSFSSLVCQLLRRFLAEGDATKELG